MSNRDVYRKIAKKNGVSVEEVKRDVQAALDQAYKNASSNSVTKAYQDKVPREGEVPTPDEFIRYMVMEVIKDKEEHGK